MPNKKFILWCLFFCLSGAFTLKAYGAAGLIICTATLNSSNEREAFKRKLSTKQFKFVELTDFGTVDKFQNKSDWFEKACDSGVKCDVLIVSGHFAGTFFGASGQSLQLETLESHSCRNDCSGILRDPREVYLFGCNTLADKGLDARTPQEYFRRLIEEGFTPLEAQRIVDARYGPFGSSFKNRMQRVFEGVPRLYGFNAVAPSGLHVETSIGNYLSQIGDFGAHLSNLKKGIATDEIWLRTMKAYNRSIGMGSRLADSERAIKANSCQLIDDKIDADSRTQLAARLLQENIALYLPTVRAFTRRAHIQPIPLQPELFKNMEELMDSRTIDATTKADLVSISRAFGWISEGEVRRKITDLFKPYVATPTMETADLMCSLTEEYEMSDALESFRDYVGNYKFESSAEFIMLGCLRGDGGILDEHITLNAIRGFSSNQNNFRDFYDWQSTLFAISRMPGNSSEKYKLFTWAAGQPQAKLHADEGNFQVQIELYALEVAPPEDQLKLFEKLRQGGAGVFFIIDGVARNSTSTDEVLKAAILLANSSEESITSGLMRDSLELQDWLAKNLDSLIPEIQKALGLDLLHINGLASEMLRKKMVQYLRTLPNVKEEFKLRNQVAVQFASILGRETLSSTALQELLTAYQTASANKSDDYQTWAQYLRHILYQLRWSGIVNDQTVLTGEKTNYICTQSMCYRHSYYQ